MREQNDLYRGSGTLKAPTFQWASNMLQRSLNKRVRKHERIANRALHSKKKGAQIDWANLEEPPSSSYVKPWLLVRLLMPAVLVEYMWTLGEMLMMPYLIDLGVPISIANLIWLVNPIVGLFIQPILGSSTDACESQYGRRRPFIVGLLVCVALAFLLIANAYKLTLTTVEWGSLLSNIESSPGLHIEGVGEEQETTRLVPWSFVICVFVGYGLADLCIDCLLIPARALVSDVLPPAASMRVNALFGTVGSQGLFQALLVGCISFSAYPSFITTPIWPRSGEAIVNSSAVNITVVFGVTSFLLVLIVQGFMMTIPETPYVRAKTVKHVAEERTELVIHPNYGSLDDSVGDHNNNCSIHENDEENASINIASVIGRSRDAEETMTQLQKDIDEEIEDEDELLDEDDVELVDEDLIDVDEDAEASDADSVVLTMGSISVKIPLKPRPRPARATWLKRLSQTALLEVRSCLTLFLRFPSLLKRVWALSFAAWFLYMTVINWLTTFVATNVLVMGAAGGRTSHSLLEVRWTAVGAETTPYPATTTLCLQLGILCMGALGVGMIVFGNIINLLNGVVGPRIAFHICLSWFFSWVIVQGLIDEAVTPLGCQICCFNIGSIFPALQSSPFIIANEYYSPDYLAVLFYLENRKLDKLLPLTYARLKNCQEEPPSAEQPFLCVRDDSVPSGGVGEEDMAEQAFLAAMKKLHPDLNSFLMATNLEREVERSTQLLQEEGRRLQSKVLRHSRHLARVQARYLHHQNSSAEPQTPMVTAILHPVHSSAQVPSLDMAPAEVNDPWTALELSGDIIMDSSLSTLPLTVQPTEPAIGHLFLDSLVEDGFVGPQDRLFGVLSQPPSPPPHNTVMEQQQVPTRLQRTISIDAPDLQAFQLEPNEALLVTVASLNKTSSLQEMPKRPSSTSPTGCSQPAASRMGLVITSPVPVDVFGANVLLKEQQRDEFSSLTLTVPKLTLSRSHLMVPKSLAPAKKDKHRSKPSTPTLKPREVLANWPSAWEQEDPFVSPPPTRNSQQLDITTPPKLELAMLAPAKLTLASSDLGLSLDMPSQEAHSSMGTGSLEIPNTLSFPKKDPLSKLTILANKTAEVEDAATLGKITAVMAISMTCAQIVMAITVGELISLLSLRNLFTMLAVIALLLQAICLKTDGSTWSRDEIIRKGLKARRRERKIALETE